jgi:GAF domain-containing protein
VSAAETTRAAEAAAECLATELRAIGADAGYVGVVDVAGRRIDVARVTPFCETPVQLEIALDSRYPIAEAVRTGAEIVIASNDDLLCRHPGLVRVDAYDHACATLPLRRGGEIVGAVNVGFEDPHDLSDDELARVRAAAARCEQALLDALS